MSAHGRVASGAGYVFAGTALGMGLAMLTRVAAARILGPAEYGVLVLGVTLLNALAIVGLVGMRKTLARQLPITDDPGGTFAAGLGISLSIAVVLAAVVVGASGRIGTAFFGADTAVVVAVAGLAVPFLVALDVAVGAFQGTEDAVGKVAVQDVARRVAVATLAIGGAALGYGALGAMTGWALGVAVSAIIAVVLLWARTDLLSWGRRGVPIDRDAAVALVSFSVPIMAADSIWRLLQEVDNLFLGYYRPSASLGAYDAAFTLARGLLLFLWSFQFLFLPVLSELHGRGDLAEMRRLYALTTKWIVVSAFPAVVVLAVFRRDVLAAVFGPTYAAGGLALLVLSVGFFAYAFGGLGRPALTAIGDLRTIVVGTTLALVVNAALNLALVPAYGIDGAAVATAASFGGVNLIYGYALYRRAAIHPLSSGLVRTLGASAVVVTILYVTLRGVLPRGLVAAFAAGVVLYAVHALIFLAVGLEEADVELLTSAARRFGLTLGRSPGDEAE